jgi:hypothetical protein
MLYFFKTLITRYRFNSRTTYITHQYNTQAIPIIYNGKHKSLRYKDLQDTYLTLTLNEHVCKGLKICSYWKLNSGSRGVTTAFNH